MTAGSPTVRRFVADDEPAVLDLLQASLGWVPNAEYAGFFDWKHRQNPFGESPAWVAVDGDRIVGFRIFLRWRFLDGDRALEAVRAVDTATHPDYQGKGIFSRLTLHALEELRDDRVAFIFNTPNDQSRPGYLKMGWQPVAALPVGARPRSLFSLPNIARARVPAHKWSLPTTAGEPATQLGNHHGLASLLASRSRGEGVRTDRPPAFLAWRYGLPSLEYRTMSAGGPDSGFVVFRLRRRGAAVEAAICDAVLSRPDPAAVRRTVGRILRETGADYAVGLDTRLAAGFVRLPTSGPTLVWRALTEQVMPPASAWHLALGDVELF